MRWRAARSPGRARSCAPSTPLPRPTTTRCARAGREAAGARDKAKRSPIVAALGALDGKVAVVTGASRGVGKGIALGLGEAGATVYVTGRNVESSIDPRGSLSQTVRQVVALGGPALPSVAITRMTRRSRRYSTRSALSRTARRPRQQRDVDASESGPA